MKIQTLEAAETQEDIIGIQSHFPFDDFDEKSWNVTGNLENNLYNRYLFDSSGGKSIYCK